MRTTKSIVNIFLLYVFLYLMLGSTSVFPSKDPSPLNCKIIIDRNAIQAGTPFLASIQVTLDPQWHTYWKNPGEIGISPTVEWNLPKGFYTQNLSWSSPELIQDSNFESIGYHNIFFLTTWITPPQNISKDQVPLQVTVHWTACKDICLPGTSTTTLYVSTQASKNEFRKNLSFHKALDTLPLPFWNITSKISHNQVSLFFSPKTENTSIIKSFFLPSEENVIGLSDQEFTSSKTNTLLKLPLIGIPSSATIKGVLQLEYTLNNIPLKQTFDLAIPIKKIINTPIAPQTIHTPTPNFLWTLFLAFIGGLILNIMPCVLPVLSLKILSFLNISKGSKSKCVQHTCLFALGILLSFWVLGGLIVAFRSSTHSLGWGFQLQNPLFVGILILLLLGFALSLFDVFILGTRLANLDQTTTNSSSSLWKSFFKGIFATLIATPCTGPLLGTALGMSLFLSPGYVMLLFTSIAIGMASPYLLFSLFPSLMRFLPKPGHWMVTCKELMGFGVIATAIWLIWIFIQLTPTFSVFLLLLSLLLVAMGSWSWGKWVNTDSSHKTFGKMFTLVCLILVFSGLYAIKQESNSFSNPTVKEVKKSMWIPYSKDKLQSLLEENKLVFIDFTASWCLSCQMNKIVLEDAAIVEAFKTSGVATLRADWTQKNERITQALREYNRNSIPLYILYYSKDNYVILPTILSKQIILKSLKK